jgi:hypothetical protein
MPARATSLAFSGRAAAWSARSTSAAAMTAPTGFPKAPIGVTVAACVGAIGVSPF